MNRYFVLIIWFGGTATLWFALLSSALFGIKKPARKFRHYLLAAIWPFALFSSRSRAALFSILKTTQE